MNKESLNAIALSESIRWQRMELLNSTLSLLLKQVRNIGEQPTNPSRIKKAIRLLDTLEYCEESISELVETNKDYRVENQSLRNGILQQRMINQRSRAMSMAYLKIDTDEFNKDDEEEDMG